MDGHDFDDLTRGLIELRSRRGFGRMLGGALAAVAGATWLGPANETAAKKGKGKKKPTKCKPACGSCQTCNKGKCKPKANGTTCSGGACQNGACTCQPDCDGKVCGSDGCGDSCGTCQNGTCTGSGQCVCPFPDTGATCSPGVCCAQEQACVGGACGACPEAPDPCLPAQEHFCGRTTAQNPFCFCVTSIDDDTTCTSVFADPFQSRDCTGDEDCATLVNLSGAELVCVNSPCLSPFMANQNVSKICLNKGCEDLNALRGTTRSERNGPRIRQFDLRAKN